MSTVLQWIEGGCYLLNKICLWLSEAGSSLRKRTGPSPLAYRLALVCIPLGFAYSFWDFGGFAMPTQWLETVLVAGFLVGTYRLARERADGYLWYVLMHVACGWLMWIQGYPWLFAQQAVSLAFIADAWRVQRAPSRQT